MYEFVVSFEHVCKIQPFELRIRSIHRTRVQRAAVRVPNWRYSSNTGVKCCRSSSEFIVFHEHVCKVLPFEIRICCILRPRVQSAAVRAPNSSYPSNTCAKYSRWVSAFGVFLEHVCKLQPFVQYITVIDKVQLSNNFWPKELRRCPRPGNLRLMICSLTSR